MGETYIPGATSLGRYGNFSAGKVRHDVLRFGATVDGSIVNGGRIGVRYNASIVFGNRVNMDGYLPTMLLLPAFAPFPHSRTMLLKNYRADNYVGFGISPVIYIAKTLFLHSNISYFQPYRQIYEKQGGGYGYGKKFHGGAFLANVALVWQSPAGPVSFSASYYQKGEQHKWYPQLNVGFLLFKKKILEE